MQLTRLAVDDSPHNKDGLLLHGWDGDQQVTAFVSRRVMDQWAHPKQYDSYRTSLFRNQYNALGKSNIDAIGRIVQLKYQRGPEFNRQHPFVDVLLADIIESGEALDMHDNPQKDYLTSASLPKPVVL